MNLLLDWTHRAHGRSSRFYGIWQIAGKRFFARAFIFLIATTLADGISTQHPSGWQPLLTAEHPRVLIYADTAVR